MKQGKRLSVSTSQQPLVLPDSVDDSVLTWYFVITASQTQRLHIQGVR